MEIIRMKQGEEGRLSVLATRIVGDYYKELLSPDQNAYMLEKFQSERGILEQVSHGYRYYFVREGERDIGFLGFYPKGERLYLSKFYLQESERGKGYGSLCLRFLIEQARKEGLIGLELNVNKYNPTTAIYEKMGFYRVRAEVNDIGHGYYMDDFVYRYDV